FQIQTELMGIGEEESLRVRHFGPFALVKEKLLVHLPVLELSSSRLRGLRGYHRITMKRSHGKVFEDQQELVSVILHDVRHGLPGGCTGATLKVSKLYKNGFGCGVPLSPTLRSDDWFEIPGCRCRMR